MSEEIDVSVPYFVTQESVHTLRTRSNRPCPVLVLSRAYIGGIARLPRHTRNNNFSANFLTQNVQDVRPIM